MNIKPGQFQKDVKSISLSTQPGTIAIDDKFQKDVKSISLSTYAQDKYDPKLFQKDVKSISLSTLNCRLSAD